MPEPIFQRLYEETSTMTWQPTQDVQRRGEWRAARRRLTIAGGAFVAVVILLSAAVLTWRPLTGPVNIGSTTPPPTSAPTTTANPTTAPPTGSIGTSPPPVEESGVPKAAMLQPADTDNATLNDNHPRGDWSLSWTLGTCEAGPAFDLTAVSWDGRSFTYADGRDVAQEVHAYAAGDAQRAFAWFRTKIAACPTIEYLGVGVRIVAQSFGGNESLLVEVKSTNRTDLYAVVRAGDLVTEILASKFNQAGAKVIGQRAAARLCAISKTC